MLLKLGTIAQSSIHAQDEHLAQVGRDTGSQAACMMVGGAGRRQAGLGCSVTARPPLGDTRQTLPLHLTYISLTQ